MVDPVTASIAVFLVSSFIGKVGEGFANRFGEKLADKTREILGTVKDNFVGDDYANLTLLRLEESPEDEGATVST